jgi:DNA-binding PadR family transcriptional regulator
MRRSATTSLGYALLGLLLHKPSSGYEVRKIFSETPMGSFSDSPGALYPALARLEERKLVRGSVDRGPGLRERKILHLTATGRRDLRTWLTAPIERADVVSRMDELMLRFSFLDEGAGPAATLEFLQSLEAELQAYLPSVRAYFKNHAHEMPMSARLALASGVMGYEARLRWVKHAVSEYRKA